MDFRGKKNHRGPGIKQWRLIVRNLDFNTKEEDIRNWTANLGNIREINLPKSKDRRFPNSCAGFCFIQFSSKKDAQKAIEELNFTMLKDRKVSVDWAIDKDSWVTREQEGKGNLKGVKTEPFGFEEGKHCSTSKNEIEVKNECNDSDEEYKTCESGNEDDDSDSAEEDDESLTDEEEEIEEDSSEASDYESDNELSSSSKDEKPQISQKGEPKITKSNNTGGDIAVSEGRVVFLRNLPYNATDNQLKGWVDGQQIGKVKFAILCRSKDTGDPMGSAFVHFHLKEAADKFLDKLNNHDGMLFDGRKLIGHRAVPKGEAIALRKQWNDENSEVAAKDKRNLYLLRASLIRPGTEQANEMSPDDAKYRERLAQTARAKLKNLTMFVSPVRLVIHNIPFSFDDAQLRKICQKMAGVGGDSITECRIMREVKGEDEKGRPIFGKSKGFGFVTFKEHTAALGCLKQLNNNTEVFTNERRPIVEFSIEDLNALRVKQRRLKLSRGEQPGTSKDSEFEQKLKAGDNPLAVQKTKRELMAGGRKWMPTKLGQKVRHSENRAFAGEAGQRRKRESDNSLQMKKSKKNTKNY